MRRKSSITTVFVENEVDVYLEDIPEEDMIDYLKDLGYRVNDRKMEDRIWELYVLYTSEHGAGPEMDKALSEFFSEYYNKVSV
jgi:hypothetical protein